MADVAIGSRCDLERAALDNAGDGLVREPRLHELEAPLAQEMRGGVDGAGHVSFNNAEEPTRLGL